MKIWVQTICLIFSVLVVSVTPAATEPYKTIGNGRLFTNDYIVDGQDRWRSGSYVFSLVRGRSAWSGQRPTQFGELLEFRFRNEVIAPSNLITPAAGDRPFAGILSFGTHSHVSLGAGLELSAGADLIFTGKGTRVSHFQDIFHNTFLGEDPDVVYDTQISGIFPTATAELSRPFRVSDSLTVRPFAEGIAGAETLLRFGVDLVIGQIGHQDLFLRDVTTGHLYRGAQLPSDGFSFVVGGDIAYVSKSEYLPEADGYVLTDSRERLRAGVHWLSGDTSAFYGLTWLTPEFEAQSEGQLIGSLRLLFLF